MQIGMRLEDDPERRPERDVAHRLADDDGIVDRRRGWKDAARFLTDLPVFAGECCPAGVHQIQSQLPEWVSVGVTCH
jgi:hypothetical protein